MSDLELNELKPFGEGELEFNQNTVPFDFDGHRLMWLTYKDKQNRELSIYHFNEMRTESVHKFRNSDGMISNMKFLKQKEKGKYVFYIKDTVFIIKYNLEDKSAVLVGQTSDAVLAMNVTNNRIREKDFELIRGQENDLEEPMDGNFHLVALDESQNVYLITGTENGKKVS